MTPRSLQPIGFGLGDPLGGQPQHVEGADQVDVHDLRNASSGKTPSLPSTRMALPVPAQLTTMRSVPIDSAVSSALATAGLVGDVGLREARAIAEFANRVFAPEVQHHHLRPGVEQPLGGGQAQA